MSDERGLLPIQPGDKLLVIEPAVVGGLGSEMGGTVLEVSENPSAAEIANILHASADGRKVVVFLYNLADTLQQVKLVEALRQAGRAVIQVVRSPYDVLQLPQTGGTLLVSYDFSPPAQQALLEILTGKQSPGGRLPVELPGLYPPGIGNQGFKP